MRAIFRVYLRQHSRKTAKNLLFCALKYARKRYPAHARQVLSRAAPSSGHPAVVLQTGIYHTLCIIAYAGRGYKRAAVTSVFQSAARRFRRAKKDLCRHNSRSGLSCESAATQSERKGKPRQTQCSCRRFMWISIGRTGTQAVPRPAATLWRPSLHRRRGRTAAG